MTLFARERGPNSGIDFGKVIISFFLGIISYNLGMKIKNKGKVE